MVAPERCLAGPLAKITLTDGSQIYGEIQGMTDGMIKVQTLFYEEDPLNIKWSEVSGIDTEEPMTFVLSNGTTLHGKPAMTQPGTLGVQTDLLPEPIQVQVGSVMAVNPPVKKAVVFIGNFNFGGSVTSGNTDLKNFSFVGELIARSERLRLTLLGRYLYGQDGRSPAQTTRGGAGSVALLCEATNRVSVHPVLSIRVKSDPLPDVGRRPFLYHEVMFKQRRRT